MNRSPENVNVTEFQRPSSKPPRELWYVSRMAGRAITDFRLIEEGDRIAVAVSGGKDSLSLLHVLRDRQRVAPVKFSFTAVHIDFEMADFSPQELIGYLENQKFPHLVAKADGLQGENYDDIGCFVWSRHRRKALFELAVREGFNKIAFGHHLDDIAETILLNQFYRGEIGAMKPRQELFAGRIVVIRPLAYVREQGMIDLARVLGIHGKAQSKCANDDTSHRMMIKRMIKEMEKDNPQLVKNIFHSLQNIKSDYLIDPPAERFVRKSL